MSVYISLKQVDGRGIHELQLELSEAAESVSSLEQRSTAAALLGYFDEKARTDQDLGEERTRHLRYRQRDETSEAGEEESERKESVTNAELMGRRVRDIGDEYMDQIYRNPQLGSYVDSMVNETAEKTAAQNAFEHFCEVASILLDCNDYGAAQQITIGRIAALFSYCYHLCKVFIQRRGVQGVVGFLGLLLGYLIRCLYRSRFYEWLSSHGGWVQLAKQTYQIVPAASSSLYLMAPVIIGGALLMGLLAYKYFHNS